MKIEKETKVVILQNGNAVMATQYVNGKKVNVKLSITLDTLTARILKLSSDSQS